jgi:hypothetical protein
MTVEEQDEFFRQIMADRDAAMAAAAESTDSSTSPEGAIVEREIKEEDFASGSG